MDHLFMRDSCINKARKSEQAAMQQVDVLRKKAVRALRIRLGKAFDDLPFDERQARVKDIVDQWKSDDPIWKGHVADNQWYIQQAIMYGTAANGDLLTTVIGTIYRNGK